jgi:hypothetical protein
MFQQHKVGLPQVDSGAIFSIARAQTKMLFPVKVALNPVDIWSDPVRHNGGGSGVI